MKFTRAYDPDDRCLAQVRELALALPEAEERETWGLVTFRIRNKLFAVFGKNHGVTRALIFKPHPSETQALSEDPRYFVPTHFQQWLALDLDTVEDWAEVREVIVDSYALIAPKTLVGSLELPPLPTDS